jgi:hypothetical protein
MQDGGDTEDDPFRSGSLREYADFVDELLRARLAETDLDDALSQCFWGTVTKSTPSRVGTWINSIIDINNFTHQVVADSLGVDRSAVTKWAKGEGIRLDKFFRVLIRFKVVDSFPRLVDDVRVEGYLGAIAYARDALRARTEGHPTPPMPPARRWPWSSLIDPFTDRVPAGRLDRERYYCLARLFSSGMLRAWTEAQARRDSSRLAALANEVREYLHKRLGRPSTLGGVRELEDLIHEWGIAWLVCHRVIDEGLFDEN